MGNPQITFGFGSLEVSPDPTYPTPSKKQIEDQKYRLKYGENKILYHQTSPEAAKEIVESGKMLRGSHGLAGGGIYFATTPSHTEHKALYKGVILECDVSLGRTYTTGFNGDSSLSYRKLLHMDPIGYDSVIIPRENGEEYVIYNHKQIKLIRKYNSQNNKFTTYLFNQIFG